MKKENTGTGRTPEAGGGIHTEAYGAYKQIPGSKRRRVPVEKFPDRYCLQLNEDFTRDEEVDFAIKRLQKRHEDKIRSLGDQSFGASLSPADIKNGIYNLFHSVFSSWRMPNRIAQERKTLKIYGKTAIFFCRPAAI